MAEPDGHGDRPAEPDGRRTADADGRERRATAAWAPEFEPLAAEAPRLLEAYLRLAALPWRRRGLSVGLKELVCVAVSASITHLYPPGVRMHVAGALRAGVPREHVMEAVAIAGRIGMRAATMALPIVLAETGRAPEHGMAAVRAIDPELHEAYEAVVAAEGGGLAALDRELIGLAVNASATHLDAEAATAHVRAALELGATAEQLVEVVELVSALGLHGCLLGAAELAAHERPQSSATPLDCR